MTHEHESGLTCNHADVGLCPQCQEDYEEDPLAWLEYGPHPRGDTNTQHLFAEATASSVAQRAREAAMMAQDPTPPDVWSEIPF